METWEKEIFRGELAQSIKREYRTLLALKLSETEAEKRIVEYSMKQIRQGSAQEGQMWLALALRQWQLGRLSDSTKCKALEWCVSTELGISKASIKMLSEKLNSPMPEKKSVGLPPWVKRCPYPVGSLLAYRIISNENLLSSPYWEKYVLLRVIKINSTPVSPVAPDIMGNDQMLVGLYNWIGDEIPNPQITDTLDFITLYEGSPILSKATLQSIVSKNQDDSDSKIFTQLSEAATSLRRETCCCLDWKCMNKTKSKEVFSHIARDRKWETEIPPFFNTNYSAYCYANTLSFDAMIVNRFIQLSEQQ